MKGWSNLKSINIFFNFIVSIHTHSYISTGMWESGKEIKDMLSLPKQMEIIFSHSSFGKSIQEKWTKEIIEDCTNVAVVSVERMIIELHVK